MKTYEVFDIGGSSVKASVMDETGKILNNEKIAIADDVDGFFDSLAEVVNKNKKEYKLEGIAISAPGAVDSETGIIGGAIVKDKRIHKGIHKHGGEFGYTILDYNPEREVHKYLSWSKGGSTFVLANNIAQRKGLKEGEIDGLKAFELYEQGDKVAVEEVENYYRYMAIGIYNIQYTYDPEVIILGGAICEREDYIDSIEKYMDELMENDGVIRPVIRKCMYGNDANKVGALYHFLTSNVK